MIDEGIDLSGRACTGMLIGNPAMQSEIVVVGDWSLAEMYNMSPEQSEFRALKQHIRQGVESGDPRNLHLAYLIARNSESDEPGWPAGEFVIWTTDMWNKLCDQLGPGVIDAYNLKYGFMVGGLVSAFARFFNDADSGLLIRMQSVRLNPGGELIITERMYEGPMPTSEVVGARLLKLVTDRWAGYQLQNPGVFRVLQGGKLNETERGALYSELWSIIMGEKQIPVSITFQETGQVRLLFDQYGNEILVKLGDQIRATAIQWLLEKQQFYRGDAYLDQIEKNAVYLAEGTIAVNLAIAQYLFQGEPILRSDEIPDFVLHTRITQAQQTMPFHLNFIRSGCIGCPVHDRHSCYVGWRNMRLSGDWPKYVDELEFSCKYYQTTYLVSQQYLTAFLQNHELAGSARYISPQELIEVINERVDIWANMCRRGHSSSTLYPR